MANLEDALEQVLNLSWQEVAERTDKLSGQPVTVPERVPSSRPVSESRFQKDFPVLVHLDRAVSLAEEFELTDLARSFARIAPSVAWSQNRSYTAENTDAEFLNGYAYAGLSGPEGPVLCTVPRGGFMLMGPDVTYPDHHHAPREVYLVLTPGTQWRLDQGDWFDVSPGDLIYHRPWQMHAMRTRSEPLLAFAGWIDAGDRLAISWSESA